MSDQSKLYHVSLSLALMALPRSVVAAYDLERYVFPLEPIGSGRNSALLTHAMSHGEEVCACLMPQHHEVGDMQRWQETFDWMELGACASVDILHETDDRTVLFRVYISWLDADEIATYEETALKAHVSALWDKYRARA